MSLAKYYYKARWVKIQKRLGRSGGVRPLSETPERAVQIGRQPMLASAKTEPRTPCRPHSAVQVSIGNHFLGNFGQPFGCDPFSTLVSTMQPCRPHPACSGFGNSEACFSRNSGIFKVAAQRAAHLKYSPRCGDLAGDPSPSSHIDALVPAALRSEYRRFLNETLKANTRANRVLEMPCAEQLPQRFHRNQINFACGITFAGIGSYLQSKARVA